MATHTTLEAELFAVLVELLGDQKLERNALRVLAGARGHELGRPYLHLCQQGLLEESRVRPGFFARLFGARETLWVQVTAYGHQVMAEVAEPEPAPVVEIPAQVELPPEPVATPVVAPLPEPAPEPAPKPARSPKPRRFTPSDFTETLGGAPVEAGFQIPASDRLDGLAESLGLLGFELTDAGKLLAVGRWAQGQTDTQVALEVVTTALAHAVRLEATGTTKLDPLATAALVGRLNETFGAYVLEGLLDADSLALVVGRMEAFFRDAAAVDDYLADPYRGMAPTAVCPDEIHVRAEIEED